MNERVGHLHTDRFLNTVIVFTFELAVAAAIPALLFFLAWRMGSISPTNPTMQWSADLLNTIAAALFPLLAMMRICRNDGLAEIHFRWTRTAVTIVRRQLRLFTWVLLCAVLLGSRGPWGDETFATMMGRFAMLALSVMLAYTVYRLTNPRSGAIAEKLRGQPNTMLARTQWLWSIVLIATPLVLLVLSFLGYQFTAVHLFRNFYLSLWLVALAYIAHELGVRWLELTAARVAWMKTLTERRQNESADEIVDEPVVNFEAVNQQTLRLFSTVIAIVLGVQLWGIWSSLLPALALLNDVQIWSYQEEVGGEYVVQYITLANLMFAATLAFLFALGAHTLPRLIELVALQRIRFTAGTLNAITTITRYALVAIGIVVVF